MTHKQIIIIINKAKKLKVINTNIKKKFFNNNNMIKTDKLIKKTNISSNKYKK